jgi:cysteine-rich repeat protein
VCGDGKRNYWDEACDDGNQDDGDGCFNNCTVAPGFCCSVTDAVLSPRATADVCALCDEGDLSMVFAFKDIIASDVTDVDAFDESLSNDVFAAAMGMGGHAKEQKVVQDVRTRPSQGSGLLGVAAQVTVMSSGTMSTMSALRQEVLASGVKLTSLKLRFGNLNLTATLLSVKLVEVITRRNNGTNGTSGVSGQTVGISNLPWFIGAAALSVLCLCSAGYIWWQHKMEDESSKGDAGGEQELSQHSDEEADQDPGSSFSDFRRMREEDNDGRADFEGRGKRASWFGGTGSSTYTSVSASKFKGNNLSENIELEEEDNFASLSTKPAGPARGEDDDSFESNPLFGTEVPPEHTESSNPSFLAMQREERLERCDLDADLDIDDADDVDNLLSNPLSSMTDH